MDRLRHLCVFCGSSTPADARIVDATDALGDLLVDAGIGLVYGGASVGLMGQVADRVLAGGGEVVGVIPRGLFTREIAHPGLTELVEVDSMHERKRLMYDRSDGFVALPGGLGTLDELAEIATWAQLGLHTKPIAVLDPTGFWQPLLAFLDGAVEVGTLSPGNRGIIRHAPSVVGLLDVLAEPAPPSAEKWIDLDET